MSTRHSRSSAFFSGFSAALTLVGVAWLTTKAVRRSPREGSSVGPVIDGVNPPDPVECAVQPQAEARSSTEPLASEAVEAPAESQRW